MISTEYALPWEQQKRFPEGGVSFSGPVEALGVSAGRSGLTRRGVVYEHIRLHPGAHVRAIAKELDIATGDLQYHLLWLEKHGFIKTRKSGFYRMVYPTMVFREDQEVLLGVLAQETPREIVLSLLRNPASTQGDLAEKLGLSQPTISWHMDRLIQLGVVRRRRASREITYELVVDMDEILRFLKSYHPEAWDRWAGRSDDIVVSARVKRAKGSPSDW